MQKNTILEAQHICKSFSGVPALKNVSFSVRQGEVHALCGGNGAGKSTLIKILTGALRADSGEIYLNGKHIRCTSPKQAMDLGIACIYQEFSIVPTIDVAHNLFLGHFPTKRMGILDNRTLYLQAEHVLKTLDLPVSPYIMAEELSTAQRQLLVIGRALTREPKILIMDEPTSALDEQETQVLLRLIGRLKEKGVSVVYISHKLAEVVQISDRITVLRDGQGVITMDAGHISQEELISHVVGYPLGELYSKQRVKPREMALQIRHLCKSGAFDDISLELYRGEVLGLLGNTGAGRSAVAETIFGLSRYDEGSILVDGEEVMLRTPRDAIRHGICLAPENRYTNGLAMLMSALGNMTLAKMQEINTAGVIDQKARDLESRKYSREIQIKAASLDQQVRFLSGGNQQKVMLSKWLMMRPKVLILDEPTRGVDMEARAQIYAHISKLAAQGVAILIISSEVQEIFGTCDRVAVMSHGRIVDTRRVAEVTQGALLSMLVGGGGGHG